MVGVTGTQGKTTTTRLARERRCTGAGVPAAVIGTVGTRILGEDVASALTTPEAPDLHRLLRQMVDAGVEACAMEVSSHALVMGRVDGIVFDVAVFLNLGRDHLDFHRDIDDYFEAKASLFTAERARRGLVERPRRVRTTAGRLSLRRASEARSRPTARRPTGRLGTSTGRLPAPRSVSPGLAGSRSPPAARSQAASTSPTRWRRSPPPRGGYDAGRRRAAIDDGPGVPGRLERIDEGQDFEVVVDYAHKPDAIEAVLATLRPSPAVV